MFRKRKGVQVKERFSHFIQMCVTALVFTWQKHDITRANDLRRSRRRARGSGRHGGCADDGRRVGMACLTLFLETLNLRSVVTTYGERRITLRHILHSVDLNGPGDVAIWRVFGPHVVIRDHVRGLESSYKSKKLSYDFGVALSPATICCAEEVFMRP